MTSSLLIFKFSPILAIKLVKKSETLFSLSNFFSNSPFKDETSVAKFATFSQN